MEIVGSGDSASVDTQLGTQTATTLTQSSTSRDDAERGVRFTVSETTDEIEVVRFSESSITTYELRTSGGTTIASGSAFGQTTFNFDQTTFQPGTTYEILFGDGGDEYDSVVASESPPVDNGVVNITGGVNFAQTVSTLYNVKSIAPVEPSSAQYQSPSVSTEAQSVFANVTLSNAQATIEAQQNTGGGWSTIDSTTVTSSGNYSLSVSGGGEWRTVVDFSDDSGVSSGTVEAEGVVATANAPTLSNPDPADGTEINNYDGTISIDINDVDFGLAQGDRVTVTASDSSGQLGSQDVTQNDTVTIAHDVAIGQNNITWTATDEYGNSDTLQQNFTTPQGLEIRNASNTSQLVNSAEVKIEFFNETQKITKTTNTGVVSFSGLNEQDNFVVQVNASGYTNRRVLLDDLLQQQAVYLVPESESTVDVRFTLQDNTGRFQAENTDFILRRGLNVSGDTTYKRVAGDRFGATQTLEFNLKQNARYRLVVRNTRGDTRELGGVTVTRAETIPVQIGALDFSIENESTYQINTSQPTQNGQRDLTFVYQDPASQTTSLDLRIHERGNVSNTLATYSKAGTFGTIKIVEPTSDTNTSYVANVTFVRAGEEFTAVVPYGAQQYPLGAGLDQGWQSIISVGLILVVGGLFSAGNLKVGALVVPGMAGVLWFVGWMGSVATAGGIILAFALGIGYNLISDQGVV
jgi:hypothetical protein